MIFTVSVWLLCSIPSARKEKNLQRQEAFKDFHHFLLYPCIHESRANYRFLLLLLLLLFLLLLPNYTDCYHCFFFLSSFSPMMPRKGNGERERKTEQRTFPTNNALLISFLLSSDAEIFINNHRLNMQIGAKRAKKNHVCNVYMFRLNFLFACHRCWLGCCSISGCYSLLFFVALPANKKKIGFLFSFFLANGVLLGESSVRFLSLRSYHLQGGQKYVKIQ